MSGQITAENVDQYLEQHQKKELLRFVAVGSVDDGKSTLIGRLLHDTQGIYDDQLSAVKRASKQGGSEIDFSLFTDGLKAEREQGITIDVAYRYFSTDKRKFIIADTPGHVQYTRNMATGASTANVGIILIDARLGVLQQSRRHAYIASLLGIPHLVVAVNKMDLMEYSEQVYRDVVQTFSAFAKPLGFKDVTFIPISALGGDNVVTKSKLMPWWEGGTMLQYLETVPIATDRNLTNFRFPVQYVLRPDLNYRGFSGEVSSGVVKKGDSVVVLPSRKQTRIVGIDTFDGELNEAHTPMGVTLRLADEIDISRGDMLVHPTDVPQVTRSFDAMVVWLNERAADTQKSYLLKHTTQLVRAQIKTVAFSVDLETLGQLPATSLGLNEIGKVRIETRRPLYLDPYAVNRATGSFILIDSLSNNTVAAGMILPGAEASASSTDDRGGSQVSAQERRERLGQSGAVVVIQGEQGASTELAFAVERTLFDHGHVSVVLDAGNNNLSAEQAASFAATSARSGLICVVIGAPTSDVAQRLRGVLEPKSVLNVTPGASTSGDVSASGDLKLKFDKDSAERAAAAVLAALSTRNIFISN
ncbi:MAG TPA: sulfate adenylyltransferase subunit CysN [Polyangiaceae bacterium]|nr:sulfate adenylyltransferase subunit CysN [Polyangiaceae bacterium]